MGSTADSAAAVPGKPASAPPLVVAGPLLRRVEPGSVTVFVVTREARAVTLDVLPGSGPADAAPLLTGSAATVALGARTHVVAVTATGDAPLAAGAGYRYRLGFTAAGGTRQDLLEAGVAAAGADDARALFCYPGGDLPAFALPGGPGDLRVLHGGARLPHAAGPDLLAHADTVLAEAVAATSEAPPEGAPPEGAPAPPVRPHLLLLHGDQSPADDVSATLLAVVRSAVATLGIPDDKLPGAADTEQPRVLGPGDRAALCDGAKLPGTWPSHLLSFAEYTAAQLLLWSDALWPAALPAVEAVHPDPRWASFPAALRTAILARSPYTATEAQAPLVAWLEAWRDDSARLAALRAGLPAVRRLLANVPVLMGLGGQDVTRGWNGGTAETTAVLGNPTARRVVQNALAAHAVLRAWGNTPDRFAAAGSPGRTLLDELAAWLTAAVPGEDVHCAAVAARAGVPGAGLVRPAGALDYHFLVTGTRWHLLVLDTATRRSPAVPGGPDRRPVADADLDTMLDLLPEPRPDTLTLVASTVPLHRVATAVAEGTEPVVDQSDSWAADTAGYHWALNRLATRGAPAGADRVRRRALVLLTGGVGHSFGDVVRFSAEHAFRVPGIPAGTPVKAESVLLHLTAGALRGTGPDDLALHLRGRRSGPTRQTRTVGWDAPVTAVQAGTQLRPGDQPPVPWQLGGGPPQTGVLSPDRRLNLRPDWFLGLTAAEHDPFGRGAGLRPGQPLGVDPYDGLPPLYDPEGGDPEGGGLEGLDADTLPSLGLRHYVNALTNHRETLLRWAAGTSVVGVSALADVTTDFTTELRGARQSVHFLLEEGGQVRPFTDFALSAALGPSMYVDRLYANLPLKRGDHDPGVTQAVYAGVATAGGGTHVRDLQRDLAELGFAVVTGDPAGVFGPHTEWAVREFQAYARDSRIARQTAQTPPPARWAERLERAWCPEEDRYAGPASGVVNAQTRFALALWKRERYRCPVVIEAFTSAGVPVAGMDNLWRHTQPGVASHTMYATDFRDHYDIPEAHRQAQPGGVPAGVPRVPVGTWYLYRQTYTHKTHTTPVVTRGARVVFEGGLQTTAASSWRPDSEVVPETLLPARAPATAPPTLAELVAARDADPDDGRLSTFKVIRSVAEVEAYGFFDVLNCYDSAFISGGLYHWTAGPTQVPSQTFPIANPVPPTADSPLWPLQPVQDSWDVRRGELWGLLALLKSRYPQAFRQHFSAYGIDVQHAWHTNAIWDGSSRVYASTATQETEGAPAVMPATVRDFNRFRGWHWGYRLAMAFRVEPEFRHAMWDLARQRLFDVLRLRWPDREAAPAQGNWELDDVDTGTGPRRPLVSEVFTSEKAVAMILRWHVNRPVDMVTDRRAGTMLREALKWARQPPAPGAPAANLLQLVTAWGEPEEARLLEGLVQVCNDAALKASVKRARDWPSWNLTTPGQNPAGFTLPLGDLPLADPAATPPRAVSERQLRSDRNSFRLDDIGLPWPESH
ncbi:peptidoglycan-binding protein (plasmid) [Streptomyces longwoodensis]|uniref:peptidoglycan-binding protein n=1 Tax=Streptomyces longwoodensis TaxID=68231 RepID=UPI0030E17008|nr:peptidoglycan-binding protein [Streptomyces longwoodensis]